MPKLIIIILMALLAALAAVLGQAAETSRVALAFFVTIFSVALSIPASLGVALVVERRRPRVVNNHYHDNRRIVIASPIDAPQVGEPERQLEVRR